MHSEFLSSYCHMHRKAGKTDCLGFLTVIVRLARSPRNGWLCSALQFKVQKSSHVYSKCQSKQSNKFEDVPSRPSAMKSYLFLSSIFIYSTRFLWVFSWLKFREAHAAGLSLMTHIYLLETFYYLTLS